MQRITRSGIKFTRNLGKTRTSEGSADPEQNPHKNNKKQNKTIREVIPENQLKKKPEIAKVNQKYQGLQKNQKIQ